MLQCWYNLWKNITILMQYVKKLCNMYRICEEMMQYSYNILTYDGIFTKYLNKYYNVHIIFE